MRPAIRWAELSQPQPFDNPPVDVARHCQVMVALVIAERRAGVRIEPAIDRAAVISFPGESGLHLAHPGRIVDGFGRLLLLRIIIRRIVIVVIAVIIIGGGIFLIRKS